MILSVIVPPVVKDVCDSRYVISFLYCSYWAVFVM